MGVFCNMMCSKTLLISSNIKMLQDRKASLEWLHCIETSVRDGATYFHFFSAARREVKFILTKIYTKGEAQYSTIGPTAHAMHVHVHVKDFLLKCGKIV